MKIHTLRLKILFFIALSLISHSCSDKNKSAPLPAPPTGLSLISKTTTSITVKWNASATATAYRLYRGSTKVYEGDKLDFTDNSLTANTTYYYSVSSLNSAGESQN